MTLTGFCSKLEEICNYHGDNPENAVARIQAKTMHQLKNHDFRRKLRATSGFCVLIGLAALLYLLPFLMNPPTVLVHAQAVAATGKEHGAALFQEKGCAYCHGANGIGGGKGPDLRDVRKRRKKEQIAQQITDGGGAMPAFGPSLEASEINDLVEFLRSKRK